MKKLKLTVFGCILSTSLSFAQPPPPHPGGSGNQGANLSVMGLVLLASSACLLALHKKRKLVVLYKQ